MMNLYSAQQRRRVIRRAIEVVQARIDGKDEIRLGEGKARQTFDLKTGGYCNRFVRQVFETALGLAAFQWRYRAERACLTLKKLEPFRVALKDRQPGDLLGFAGDPGHIVIYLGMECDPAKELVAENTSNGRRGFPRAAGTKVTRYEALRARVTGCYRLFG
ncbi:MAG: hypothetical protein ACYC63_09030 [Armatimonadota bacterium]